MSKLIIQNDSKLSDSQVLDYVRLAMVDNKDLSRDNEYAMTFHSGIALYYLPNKQSSRYIIQDYTWQ